MRIRHITVHKLVMKLREPFVTSYGVEWEKDFLLLFATTEEGVTGSAECTAFREPLYLEETTETARHILCDFLIPAILDQEFDHPDDVSRFLQKFRGNYMAKATLEVAIWDAYARQHGLSLRQAIGGVKEEVQGGISLGIEPTIDQLLAKIDSRLQQGFTRIKVKIKPGHDDHVIEAIRHAFGSIALMADANSAYQRKDIALLKALDAFDLMMIEQPFAYDDMLDHAWLQPQLRTPICLDESIRTIDDARKAIEIGACRVINVKIGRVGGITPAREIIRLCERHGVDAWCGGMLEAGIGRACNLAISSLSGMTMPGDIAPSERYFERDVILSPIRFSRPGFFAAERGLGHGVEIDEERLREVTVWKQEFSAQ